MASLIGLRATAAAAAAARGSLLRSNSSIPAFFISSKINLPTASFSSDSHDDFAAKRTVINDDEEAFNVIKDHVKNNPIMVYMKGNPSQPMCGFSGKVVGILQKEEVDFSSVNVLEYPNIREGVKKFSEWPTIPQLYVNGEFIGGCDIITTMHENGELKELLSELKK